MTRTKVLQEIRQMRFEEAYGGWQERRLTQEEAARLLGVCERTFRRYVGSTKKCVAIRRRIPIGLIPTGGVLVAPGMRSRPKRASLVQ